MNKPRAVQFRIVQSRHNQDILAVFRGDVGIKLTMSKRKQFGPVAESKPGTRFNANDANWEDLTPGREAEAEAAMRAVFGNTAVLGVVTV